MTKLIAITGSLCTGKSTVLKLFEDKGIKTFSSDKEISIIIREDKGVIEKILNKYPQSFKDGAIDKSILAKFVFSNKQDLIWIENILYPILSKKREAFKSNNSAEAILAFEVPLLYEKKLEKNYDFVVTTYASEKTKIIRCKNRGMSEEMMYMILSFQLNDEEKKTCADFIINTDYDIDTIRDNVSNIIKQINNGLK